MCSCIYKYAFSTCSQNEDLAALAAQQYYVELGENMNSDRLSRMLPSAIPDSFLAGPGMQEKWMHMVMASFKRVCMLHGQPHEACSQ